MTIRIEKVQAVRDALRDGTYPLDENWDRLVRGMASCKGHQGIAWFGELLRRKLAADEAAEGVRE